MSLIDEPCRRCKYRGAWLLRPVRELGQVMVVEAVEESALLVPRETHLGWYQAAVCGRCGHTLWWAREYAPARAPATVDPCRACDATKAWIVDTAPDRVDRLSTPMRVQLAPPRSPVSRGGWNGTLGVRVCCGCALASWSCRPDPQPPDEIAEGQTSSRPCARCGGPQWLVAMSDHSREGRVERAVATHRRIWFPTGRGRFEADVCRACFTVDWYGADLDELRVSDGDGVFWLERSGTIAGGGGPYR